MTPESSPFFPGQTVPVEFFVGRTSEIERLRSMVRGASNGRFWIGFVTGERGVGKSSLAGFVRWLTEQEQRAVGCHVSLGGVSDLGAMLNTTFDRLLKDSISRSWHRQVRDFLGDRVRKVGLFGATLELNLRSDELATLERNFVHSVRQLLNSIAEDTSLLLILDDINGLVDSSRFANWLKSMVDEITLSQETTRLCVLMVGLEERRRQLIKHQPSPMDRRSAGAGPRDRRRRLANRSNYDDTASRYPRRRPAGRASHRQQVSRAAGTRCHA